MQRSDSCLVLSFSQLQALGKALKYPTAFTFAMDLLRLVSVLHEFTVTLATSIVVKHLDQLIVATNGEVSTTKLETDLPIWRCQVATHCAVWWMQNKSQPLKR